MRFPFRFPAPFGGPDRTVDVEHEAILDTLRKSYDVEAGTAVYIETRAEALVSAQVWKTNHRVQNQMIPERMLEALEDWETACHMVPAPTDTLKDRRTALSAHLRTTANNALVDLEDAARVILGVHFVALAVAAEDDWIVYWPGVSPGPPGYEFSSNRAHICIHMTRDGLSDDEFHRLRAKLINTLDASRPCWMTYSVGVGSGVGTTLVCDVGIVGQTII